MDVVSTCPLSAWGFVWQTSAGATAQTVVVKATFQLTPGESVLAKEQDGAVEEDEFWDDDPTRSVRVASDKVPYKARADVMLVGHAYAPEKQPVRSLPVRLVVGELDKSIEVWCDRVFRAQDGQLLEGQRFVKMPLRWERAAGGPETNNPVGVRFDAPPNSFGMIAIPNLQPPGIFVSQRSDTFVPVCFAPIGGGWPSRVAKLGPLAGAFASPGWETRPLPQLPDYGYFQAAPRDQQLVEIRPNERLVLENLHPEHPRLVTSLPGISPKVSVERATGERESVKLVADTLWIDTDRGVCVVVWRGMIGLRHAAEAGRIVVTLDGEVVEELDDEDLLKTIPPAAVKGAAAGGADEDDLASMTLAPGFDLSRALAPVMPFLGQDKPQPPAATAPESRAADPSLPFGNPGGLAALRSGEPAPPPVSADSTMYVPMRKPSAPAIPAVAPPVPPTPPVVNPPPPVAPPPMVTRPPVVDAIAPPIGPSAWSAGAKETTPAPTLGQMMAQAQSEAPKAKEAPPALAMTAAKPEVAPPAVVDEAAAKRGWKPVGATSGDGSKGPPLSPNPVLSGAAAASDAAAAAAKPKDGGDKKAYASTAPVSPPKAVIELLWYDPAALPRIRRQPGWKEVLGQIKGKAFEDELSGDSPPEKRQEARDRRDVAGLLARGDAVDMAGIQAALANAVTEDGTFVPPLVLVAGDLEFPFDELETLKANMAALAPLASGDKALKEQLDTTEELLKTPWLKGASGIAEGLTAKLKEVFGRGNRVLPPRYLEGHTERMLLEQRAYQKRTVLGKTCIRSLLHVPGVQGGVPVYLPEALGQELPAFQRFAVRMVGEVRGRVEQYEGQEVAVRGVGVGRAVALTMRRV
ncbi:DUF2169 family type VI secretion system accessory protein [Polyangium spumosum]|uniref:DUF2169 domain-containing protein n=1 Tax=Polyangium spumosum TaxID=889282 RepID=A0A6N7Q1A6_9BACT|nr:DUF2169 domain-containing protein [Polyangium spumosum]MRG96385.1 DUF2169 domain-containing protein [Polyangium spumosum]